MKEGEGLKRQLSFTMCIALAMGAIIGAGVFSYTGIGIQYAGTGVPIAFIAAGILVVFLTLPSIQLGSAIPATGGTYMYVSRFVHPVFGYVQVLNSLIGCLNIAIMSISFAQYFCALVPSANAKIVGAIICIGLATISTFGAKITGNVQKWIVAILVVALGIFIFGGIPHIKPEYMSFSKMFKPLGGLAGLWAAMAIVRYTLQGGTIVMALGDEVENPGKTIPRAFFIGTAAVTLLYAIVAYVTVGVAPMNEVAGQPLSVAASVFLTGGWFSAFIVGGALLATLTTLNGSYLIYSRIHYAAAKDGIWPSIFKKTNKYGVPYVTLWACTLMGLIPILTGMDLSDILKIVAVPGLLLSFIYYIPSMLLPSKLPNCHKNAWFHMSKTVTIVICVISVIISCSLGMSLFSTMKKNHYIGMIIFFGIGLIYWFIRIWYLKKYKDTDLVANMKGYHPYWIEKEKESSKVA